MMSVKLFSLFFLFSFTLASKASFENTLSEVHNRSLHWGTYRPNLYLGLRTKSPKSLQTGFIWFGANDYNSWQSARHSCEMDQNLKYGFEVHDGRTFSKQSVIDPQLGLTLDSLFLKDSKNFLDWTLKINGMNRQWLSLIYYVFTEDEADMKAERLSDGSVKITGETEDLGAFEHFITNDNENSETVLFATDLDENSFPRIKELLVENILVHAREILEPNARDETQTPPPAQEIFRFPGSDKVSGTLIAVQKIIETDFKFHVVHSSVSAGKKSDSDKKVSKAVESFDKNFEDKQKEFDEKFEGAFGLKSRGYDAMDIEFAKTLFSDVMGGIGFFYGDSIVDLAPYEKKEEKSENPNKEQMDDLEKLLFEDEEDEIEVSTAVKPEITKTKPLSLLTATPSRPFFPRGFLWDEGFHDIIIGPFDSGMMLEILDSWFELMDENGWIAREQILGEEARRKVPLEFQVQYPHFANPPTLVVPVAYLIAKIHESSGNFIMQHEFDNNHVIFKSGDDVISKTEKEEIRKNAKKKQLVKLYNGLIKNFNWYLKTQRNTVLPEKHLYRWRGKTETHCLPSGIDDYPRPPLSPNEIHVDLLSWIGFFAKTLKEIAVYLDDKQNMKHFGNVVSEISSNLNKYHWNKDNKIFCDAIMTDDGTIDEHYCNAGYISLMPFMHGLLELDSEQLKSNLKLISENSPLWSQFGIRSLSSDHELYGQGENYWRGPIWINVNYMILRALKVYYMKPECKFNKEATAIYKELRENVINTVKKDYERTGFTWEQYNAEHGTGQRSHPFTGWTALVVNIMAEIY